MKSVSAPEPILDVLVSRDNQNLNYVCQFLGSLGWACGLCGQPTLGYPCVGTACTCGAKAVVVLHAPRKSRSLRALRQSLPETAAGDAP